MSKFSKEENSWVMYDWATSAYSIIISTAVFPIFFKASAINAGISPTDSTAYLGYTVSIATFILAMLAPILGTIADYQGFKKRFFSVFFGFGVIFTAFLAFVPGDQWLLLLVFYTLGVIGSSGANIFYDAFLVDVTTEDRMDQVSSRGFAMGYIGSTIPFVIAIAIIILAQQEVIPITATTASQIAFIITALWWGLFTIPMLKNVQQRYFIKREPKPVINSFKRLWSTFVEIRKYRGLFIFLLAYFFYIDGVHTIITMSTAYGTDLGITATNLLIILFVTQLVAAPFAILYGRLAKKFTGKVMLYVAIIVYTIVCIYAFFLDSTFDFWILALLVGSAQGGIQALSRSYFAKLVPKEKSNEFFGFYNIFGKFAAIMGPMLLGMTAQVTGSTSNGVFSLIILFIIGFIILIFVPNPEKQNALS